MLAEVDRLSPRLLWLRHFNVCAQTGLETGGAVGSTFNDLYYLERLADRQMLIVGC